MNITGLQNVVAGGVLRGATFSCSTPLTILLDDGDVSAAALTLRLFAGIARPQSGRVLTFGVDPASDAGIRRDVALLGDPALLSADDARDEAPRIAAVRSVDLSRELLADADSFEGRRALGDALANDARARLVLISFPEHYVEGRDAILNRGRAALDRGARVIVATRALDDVLSLAADDRAVGIILARGVAAATAPAHALPWAVAADGLRTRVVRVVVGEGSAKLAAELLSSDVASSLALIEPISAEEVRFHTRDPRAVAKAIASRAKDGLDVRALTIMGAPVAELLGGFR
jgi:hypothetical protein